MGTQDTYVSNKDNKDNFNQNDKLSASVGFTPCFFRNSPFASYGVYLVA